MQKMWPDCGGFWLTQTYKCLQIVSRKFAKRLFRFTDTNSRLPRLTDENGLTCKRSRVQVQYRPPDVP